MNVLLWVLQIGLAVHTVIGAVWKFSNTEQTVPSLKAIPHGVWRVMSVVEILAGVGLVIPVLTRNLGILVPVSAIIVAVEMLFFSGLHLVSRAKDSEPVIYWLVVAAISAFIAWGRLVIVPF